MLIGMTEALCEWGMASVEALHARVAVLVIVDVLSFCIAVTRAARTLAGDGRVGVVPAGEL